MRTFLHFLPAFCPYHIGHFSVVGLGFEDYVSSPEHTMRNFCLDGTVKNYYFFYLQVKASHFDGLITTVVGYILLAAALVVCHVSSSCCTFSFFFGNDCHKILKSLTFIQKNSSLSQCSCRTVSFKYLHPLDIFCHITTTNSSVFYWGFY